MMSSLRDAWKIIKPYWKSQERWVAGGLLLIIIALSLGEVGMNVVFNYWYNDFYNSLQELDKAAFIHAIIRFCYLAFFFIIIVVYKSYFNQMLRIKWRRWLTSHFLAQWLSHKNYYHIQLFGNVADNPDQRISDDINQFIESALDLSLGLLSSVVTLFSFLAILWTLSGPLDFTLGGVAVHIPGYMVWVALVYAILGSWLTVKVGRPLVALNFNQQRYEADFRFSLIRLREHSESIAFYKGETQEQISLLARFGNVVDNFWGIMKRQKSLNWLTSFYGQIAIIFPYIVVAPRYFAAQIKLGQLMQTASTFGHVQGALSYIVDSYNGIANWQAVINRLIGFMRNIERAEAQAVPVRGYERTTTEDNIITASNLSITLPDGSALLKDISLTLAPGDSLLITGPSGSGKSTLLRALAGLWPFVQGTLSLPAQSRMLFVPQKPYLPLGTLREALYYPSAPVQEGDELNAVLALCKLEHLADKLDVADNWSHILSTGEQQRVAFARILLTKPQFVFLDEATSACDEALEQHLYTTLKSRLPATAIVSIGHRSTLRAFHAKENVLP